VINVRKDFLARESSYHVTGHNRSAPIDFQEKFTGCRLWVNIYFPVACGATFITNIIFLKPLLKQDIGNIL
jgi:hypothetical protein